MSPRNLRETVVVLLLAVAAVPVQANEADDHFRVAMGHYAVKRWKLAAEEFEALLQRSPNYPKAGQSIFLLGEALLQSGDCQRASVQFRRYLDRNPEGEYTRAALFRVGEATYMAGKSAAAAADLKRFQLEYPADKLNAYVLTYLGDVEMERENTAAAANYFRRCLTQFPNGRLQDDCRFGLARALERLDKNEEAKRFYLAVAGKSGNPLADDAQFHLGVLHYTTGDYAKAIETYNAFETGLANSPWRPKARLGRGWALMKLDRLDEAKATFLRIADDPEVGVDAKCWLGMVQRRQEDWAAAAKTLLEALETAETEGRSVADVDVATLRFYAGDSLRRCGRAEAAGKQFNMLMASTRGSETRGSQWLDDAMHGQMQVAAAANDHQTIDRLAKTFESQCPRSSLRGDVHRLLARSRLERDDPSAAVELLEPLVAVGILDEQGLADRYLLAQAYEGSKRYEDALAVLLPVVDAAGERLRGDALLTQGALLLAMRKYADAVEPLETLAATAVTETAKVKGGGSLAICYARTDQLDRAKRLYDRLQEEHAGDELLPVIVEQLAEAAYAANDLQWARQLFDRIQAETPWKGLAGRGWCLLRDGKPEEAESVFDEVLKSNPPAETAAEVALARGRILEQLDRPDPALLMYDLVIEEHADGSQHPEALLAAARLRAKLGQTREASLFYEQLLERYPDRDGQDAVLYEWAWVLHDSQKEGESLALFERLRKHHAKSRYAADAAFRLAQRAFEAKDYARVGELTGEILSGNADGRIRESTIHLRGQLAVTEKDWDRVDKEFAAALKQFPESPSRLMAEFWVAEAAYRRGEYDLAGERFEQLAQRIQGRQDAWLAMVPLRRAQVLAQGKKWSEAYAVASKIEENYPNFAQQYEAHYLIGRCLHARADLRGARDAFQRVIRSPNGEKTETAAMAQWMIGETFFHQKDYESALREYLRVEILYAFPTWQAGALLQAGKCYEKLGQWNKAAELYARLLKTYPSSPFAESASERLNTPPGKRDENARAD